MSSTLQFLQTLDPFTYMYTYTDLCLAHPLESWTPFDIVVNSAHALLTMPVTYKPTNMIDSPFIMYSGTSAYRPFESWFFNHFPRMNVDQLLTHDFVQLVVSSEYSCMLVLFCDSFAFRCSAIRSIYMVLSIASDSVFLLIRLSSSAEGAVYTKISPVLKNWASSPYRCHMDVTNSSSMQWSPNFVTHHISE